MTNINRRRFLGYAGGAAVTIPFLSVLPGCSSDESDTSSSGSDGDSSKLGDISYQLSWLKDSQWAGEYQADSKGYWSTPGLGVTLLAGGGDIDPTAVIVAGKALTGPPGSAPIAGAIAAGADLKIVASKYRKSPLSIVSLTDTGIASVQDLVGKSIGVSEFNIVTFNTFLSLNGLTDADVKVVPYDFDPTPLINGDIDGLLGYANDEPISLRVQGVMTDTLILSDNGYDVISNAYVVEASVLDDKAQRAQLVALLTGIVKGWTDVIADPEGLTPGLLEKYAAELEIDPELGIGIVSATADLITGGQPVEGIFDLVPETVATTVEVLAKEETPLEASVFDTSVMDEVRGNLA